MVNASAKSSTLRLMNGSTLTFEQTDAFIPYHFAFNIPSFQIREALNWLQSISVDMIPYKEQFLVDFKAWNADAVYFYDPDGNILELIARKNLNLSTNQAFSAKSILSISEIGMPVQNVFEASEMLKATIGLKQYSGDRDYFCAMGDEEGLFIIVDEARKKWMPTEIPAKAAAFESLIDYAGREWAINYRNAKLEITSFDPLQT